MKKTRYLFAVVLSIFCFSALSASRVSQETRQKLAERLPIFGLSIGDSVLIRTFKKESRLELWMKPQNSRQYTLFQTYPICYYSGGLGPKQRVGDKVTPEGFYAVLPRSLQPNSRFHLSMNIGYPNAFDRYHGRTGSLLMIHGACDAIGCFAMSNPQVEEIYYLVEQALLSGQKNVPVHAFPFHLTDENMAIHNDSVWYEFWQQLKMGYDLFNRERVPPIIDGANGKYEIFSGF